MAGNAAHWGATTTRQEGRGIIKESIVVMAVFLRGNVWWYEFWFAGRRVRESAKTHSKTLAKQAEHARRRELEEGFNSIIDRRAVRVQTIREVAAAYLEGYVLRNQSPTFAKYAVGHVTRLLGAIMIVDVDERLVLTYQEQRLKEQAAPKTINDEVVFLLRLLADRGDRIRAHLRKQKTLKLRSETSVIKVYSPEEKTKLATAAKQGRSPLMYLALMFALNAGLRSKELRTLRWQQINLKKAFFTVGKSKTPGGAGRTIPLNNVLLAAIHAHAKWYKDTFGMIDPEWYVFPFGKARQYDPTRPITTLKTAWVNAKKRAGVIGRLHDSRHTLITELAEHGAGDQTIMDIAGHVSKQMLKHYSHIRMHAKRDALDAIAKTQCEAEEQAQQCSPVLPDATPSEVVSPQKSPQLVFLKGGRRREVARKQLKKNGSPGRIRTYNPSVNSRMLYR